MSGQREVLETGRPRWPRRRLLAVLIGIVIVAAGAVALDQRSRHLETEQVMACREQATESVAAAFRRLTSMTAYVRPALSSPRQNDVRTALFSMVSRSVSGADERLVVARTGCESLTVSWLHRDLRRHRAECVTELERQIAWLRSVSADGSLAFQAGEGSRGSGCG